MKSAGDLQEFAEIPQDGYLNALRQKFTTQVRHILALTDPSNESRKSIKYAMRLARHFRAKLTLLHVYETLSASAEEFRQHSARGETEPAVAARCRPSPVLKHRAVFLLWQAGRADLCNGEKSGVDLIVSFHARFRLAKIVQTLAVVGIDQRGSTGFPYPLILTGPDIHPKAQSGTYDRKNRHGSVSPGRRTKFGKAIA
jgi:hypothetical protein